MAIASAGFVALTSWPASVASQNLVYKTAVGDQSDSDGTGDAAAGDFMQPADAGRGRDIVLNGYSHGETGESYPCSLCHGKAGAGDVGTPIPRLDGQSPHYIYTQLKQFASGKRPNETMQQVARSLDDQAMRDVALYYSMVRPETDLEAAAAQSTQSPDPETLTKGGVIAAVGDMHRGVQACANCHGPKGSGLPPTYPYLAGQYSDYLKTQLKRFASGKRGGDPLDIMQHIAARLTDDQVEALAAYYSSIAPSTPVPAVKGTIQAVQPRTNAANGQPGALNGDDDKKKQEQDK